MADPTASDIYNKLGLMIDDWQTFLDENIEWLGGASYEDDPNPPDGDPANAGKRYVTDSTGNRMLVWTPNSLNDIADSFQGNYDELVIYINAELDKTNLATAAMSKAEFDAQREANNNQFAQSGFVHFGKQFATTGYTAINEGMWTKETTPNVLGLGRRDDSSTGTSETPHPLTNVAGVVSTIMNIGSNEVDENVIKFPEAPDGTVTYDSVTGEVTQHADSEAAFLYANTSDDIEVVINRHDMFGFEAFLREITDADPFAYPKGMIQSQATAMNGVATVDDNVRPITYFAVFDGDASSRGKGVNWFTATNAQKKAIASDRTNNIYYDAETGKWYQWCLRQRTIAGAGNGDWFSTDSYVNHSILEFQGGLPPATRTAAQGVYDTATQTGARWYAATTHNSGLNTKPNKGVFTASSQDPNIAVNGECYFYVMGTVKRLNQGARHPSFNPLGASTVYNTSRTSNAVPWHHADAVSINSEADCFNYGVTLSGTQGKIGTNSGRSDGRHFDGIYASGQGGVNDDRMTAWESGSPEEAAKIEAKVENGTYRGEQELLFTTITAGDSYIDGSDFSVPNNASPLSGGGEIYFTDGSFVLRGITDTNSTTVKYEVVSGTPTTGTHSGHWVVSTPTNQSVSGEFEQVDGIGDPAVILLTPALANGWLGGWIPVVPNGVINAWPYTKKSLNTSSSQSVTITNDNGATWSTASRTFNSVTNSNTGANLPAGRVEVISYTAFANQTKEVTARLEALNGLKGLLGVVGLGNYDRSAGALLMESLLGIVAINGVSNTTRGTNFLKSAYINSNGYLANTTGLLPVHNELEWIAPSNNGAACKALVHQISNNGQCSLGYQANELTYANGSWGDSASAVTITDSGSDTFIDDNGNTNLSVAHELAKPYGATKNVARAGTSTVGVDL